MNSQSGGCCGGRRERAETNEQNVTTEPRKTGIDPGAAAASKPEQAGKVTPRTERAESGSSDPRRGSHCR